MVNVGIIGAGRIGQVHMNSILTRVPNAKIKAVADPFLSEEADKKAKAAGAEYTTKDYKDILADKDIDAVIICSSTDTHSPISIEAIKAGKHVFCEKPIDHDVDKIKEVIKTLEGTGLKYQVGFNRRFDHNFEAAQRAVVNGKIGAPHIIKITSRDPEPPSAEYVKVSGGMFLDMTIHDFDMVRFLAGCDAEEVYVQAANLVDPEIGKAGDVDTAIITLKMENGALAVIDNSRQAVYGYDQRAEVFGSKGMVAIKNDSDSTAVIRNEDGVTGEKPQFFFLERYMDAYGKEKILPAKEKVSLAYKEYSKCKIELGSMNMNEEQRNRELAFLEFEIKEIEKANLQPGEDEELEARYRKMSNAKLIVDSLQLVHNLTGYESKEGAGETVGEALKEFSHVTQYDPELTPLAETLTSVDGLLNDFNRELSTYLDELTFDEGEFYETERRLDLINGLKAKYGRTIEEIFTYRKLQEEKLEKLHKYEENLQELKERLRELENILEKKSDELAEIRKEYSKQLEQKIIQGLKDLNFLDVNFAIDFRKKKNYTDNGTDDIQYLISTNPGETLKPLGQIVSGGELSRIMLALKAILADRDEIETLIFDEIDTGISGRTAQKVSEKMAVIGQHHQVLCITHLPQIAAMAQQQYLVEKSERDGRTYTNIRLLDREGRRYELARLSGGDRITDTQLAGAEELLARDEEFRASLS